MRNKQIIFSLRVKLTLFTILLVAAVGLMGMTITAARMRDTLSAEIKEKGVAVAKGMARASEDALMVQGDDLYLFQFITSAMKNRGVSYAVIVDENGTIRAHSDIQKSGKRYASPPGMAVSEQGDGYTMSSDTDGGGRYDISVPITLTGEVKKTIGYVHLGLTSEPIEEAVRNMQARVSEVGFIGILLGGIGAFMLAMVTVSPIKLLVKGVNEIGKGNLDQEIKSDNRDEIGELTAAFNQMAKGLREKEFIKDTFARYMSKQLADQLLDGHAVDKLELGGENREVTILFTDIRGFTSMSEKLDPKGVISFLNEYFVLMVEVISEHKGWIDKFIGDAIMVIYGLPRDRKDDAVRAVRTGLKMKEKMAAYNAARAVKGLPPMHIGIGINTGFVVAGNVGSKDRMNYTVIGDEVNIAARLVTISKEENVIISRNTYEAVKEHFIIEKKGMVTLKGKTEPQQVYEVISENPWRKEQP